MQTQTKEYIKIWIQSHRYLSRWGPAGRRHPPSQSSLIQALTSSFGGKPRLIKARSSLHYIFKGEGETALMIIEGLEAKLLDRRRGSLPTSVTATMITRWVPDNEDDQCYDWNGGGNHCKHINVHCHNMAYVVFLTSVTATMITRWIYHSLNCQHTSIISHHIPSKSMAVANMPIYIVPYENYRPLCRANKHAMLTECN